MPADCEVPGPDIYKYNTSGLSCWAAVVKI